MKIMMEINNLVLKFILIKYKKIIFLKLIKCHSFLEDILTCLPCDIYKILSKIHMDVFNLKKIHELNIYIFKKF